MRRPDYGLYVLDRVEPRSDTDQDHVIPDFKSVLLKKFLPGILYCGLRKIHAIVEHIDIQRIEFPFDQHLPEVVRNAYMVFNEAKRDGIDQPDGQPFRKAVHVIEPVIAVDGGNSRYIGLPGGSQRKYVGLGAMRMDYVIVAFLYDFPYFMDVAEYIGRFDHGHIYAQGFRVVGKNTGAEADEFYLDMA